MRLCGSLLERRRCNTSIIIQYKQCHFYRRKSGKLPSVSPVRGSVVPAAAERTLRNRTESRTHRRSSCHPPSFRHPCTCSSARNHRGRPSSRLETISFPSRNRTRCWSSRGSNPRERGSGRVSLESVGRAGTIQNRSTKHLNSVLCNSICIIGSHRIRCKLHQYIA